MDIVERLTDRAYQARAFKEEGEMLVMDERQARLDEEATATITALRKRVEELERKIRQAADQMDQQVKACDGYAEEYARKDEARPTAWQIGNSHFTDIARDLRAALAKIGG